VAGGADPRHRHPVDGSDRGRGEGGSETDPAPSRAMRALWPTPLCRLVQETRRDDLACLRPQRTQGTAGRLIHRLETASSALLVGSLDVTRQAKTRKAGMRKGCRELTTHIVLNLRVVTFLTLEPLEAGRPV